MTFKHRKQTEDQINQTDNMYFAYLEKRIESVDNKVFVILCAISINIIANLYLLIK